MRGIFPVIHEVHQLSPMASDGSRVMESDVIIGDHDVYFASLAFDGTARQFIFQAWRLDAARSVKQELYAEEAFVSENRAIKRYVAATGDLALGVYAEPE